MQIDPNWRKKIPLSARHSGLFIWLRGKDLNLRPSGYEPEIFRTVWSLLSIMSSISSHFNARGRGVERRTFITLRCARAAEECEIVPRTSVVLDRDWMQFLRRVF